MDRSELPGRRIGPDPEDRACYIHGTDRNSFCPECKALRSSLALRRIYADVDAARTRALVQHLADEYATPEGFAKACGFAVRGTVE